MEMQFQTYINGSDIMFSYSFCMFHCQMLGFTLKRLQDFNMHGPNCNSLFPGHLCLYMCNGAKGIDLKKKENWREMNMCKADARQSLTDISRRNKYYLVIHFQQ